MSAGRLCSGTLWIRAPVRRAGFDDRDPMAGGVEQIGCGETGDTGPGDDDAHRHLPVGDE